MDSKNGAVAAAAESSGITATSNAKKLLQMENYKKVQRRKLERKFMQEIKSNYSLEHLNELKEKQEAAEGLPKPTYTPRAVEPAPRSICQKPTDTIRVVNEFSGQVRALELTQGGATLWTAESDGSIGVRSGITGSVVHSIQKHGDLFVVSLFATDTHMWVGYNEGTVRVFDHLVYLCVHEAKFHTDIVTCFAQTFDSKVFSGSGDTTIVKWDTEKHSFELMTKIIAGHTKQVRCLATYGYHLFSGSDESIIRCVDTETGHKVQLYEGHTGAITALVVVDGFLFSGSTDFTVRVWNIDTGECIKTLTEHTRTSSAITSLVSDGVGHRVWSSDSSGRINVYDSSVDVNFKHIQTLEEQSGTSIVGMRNFCAIDATKVWSLASNGINKVWYSATNKVEDAMQETIQAMQDILDEDIVELDKWRELINKMSAIDERRKKDLSEAMFGSTNATLLRIYFLKFTRWIQLNRVRQRRKVVAGILAASCKAQLRQLYYWKLWNNYKTKRQQFLKMSMTRNLLMSTQKGLINVYWKRMCEFRDKMKAKEGRDKMLRCLLRSTERNLIHYNYCRWFRCIDARKKRQKREHVCQSLMRGSDSSLRRLYYYKIIAFMGNAKKKARKLATCNALSSLSTRGRMQTTFHKWVRYYKLRKSFEKKRKIADVLSNSKKSTSLARFYTLWSIYAKERGCQHLGSQIEASKQQLTALTVEYKRVEGLIERQKLLEAAQSQIDAALAERQKKLERIAKLKKENENLQIAIKAKEEGKQNNATSVQDQLDDLMARLKSKVLNFHSDYALIAQINGQEKNIRKIFLEAHIRVKRVVVDLTKQTNPPLKWPLTKQQLHEMPSHQIKVVLRAIKEMIIAFDMMDVSVRNSLEVSDVEIVENADTILDMATICVDHIAKTLGKAASRIEKAGMKVPTSPKKGPTSPTFPKK